MVAAIQGGGELISSREPSGAAIGYRRLRLPRIVSAENNVLVRSALDTEQGTA